MTVTGRGGRPNIYTIYHTWMVWGFEAGFKVDVLRDAEVLTCGFGLFLIRRDTWKSNKKR